MEFVRAFTKRLPYQDQPKKMKTLTLERDKKTQGNFRGLSQVLETNLQ